MENTQVIPATQQAKPNGVAHGVTKQPSYAELQQQLAEAKAKLAARAGVRSLTLKIGDKGGISVYGLGRFPVTLYAEQWERLLADGSRAEILAACVSGVDGQMPKRKGEGE